MGFNAEFTPKPYNVDIAKVSVITTCYGRNDHLYNLLSSLEHGSVKPAEIIIVNDDADPKRLAEYDLNIIKIATTAALDSTSMIHKTKSFDIGHNRNLGARHASHEKLIFLDVDCIANPSFVEQIAIKLAEYPEALLMGQPKYLTRPLTKDESVNLKRGILDANDLEQLSVYNPYRHNFETTQLNETPTAILETEDYGAFWSLCFAISRQQFDRIGGFDVAYVGYGAEDTDFGFSARELGIKLYLSADVVYHQQHSVYRPPLNHLNSIVVNANIFYKKWHHWPMQGWLQEFVDMGLIDWQQQQLTPIKVIRAATKDEKNSAHCPDAAFV
ncbi:glycosyltransferase [Psychrobacter sp.]|uniref:glycosyltransferase family 2 protein n=1 Tax=Psychrobacter sp. TaxID=56811 RepID=UPI0025FF8E57|nr:glycosyltransferase [Psychrobacter sp.]